MWNISQVERAVKNKGYQWFDDGKYNVNIVGIRNSNTSNTVTNKFDDWITVSFKDETDNWVFKCYEATTDPGLHWVSNLLNPNGVAILVPNQYRGSHKIGLHQGRYEALRQSKPLKVYRDGNKDTVYDFDDYTIEEGIYGINIHRATSRRGGTSLQIDKWSAGCQVIASFDDFEEFMEIMRKAETYWSNSFTYTLITSVDIE